MPEETHQTLKALGEKVPLVAITNGNARPEQLGIADYFQFALRAGPDGRRQALSGYVPSRRRAAWHCA